MGIAQQVQPMAAGSMEGGFSNPVFDAQKVFDKLMNAMARPGKIVDLEPLAFAPSPLFSVSAALLAALCDTDTTVWFDRPQSPSTVGGWLSFQTGASLTDQVSTSTFAIISNPGAMQSLGAFAQGTQEYPDRSVTLIIQVEAITSANEWTLRGPGIKKEAYLSVKGLADDFLDQWQMNNEAFPLGVDAILTSPSAFVCLPRTVRIRQSATEGTN